MKRREFLKHTTAVGLATLIPHLLFSKDKNPRVFNIKYRFDIKNTKNKDSLRLWNPIPYTAIYQKVKRINFNGNYDDFNINTQNKYDARVFYAKWNKKSKNNYLNMDMQISTQGRSVPLNLIEQASKKNITLPNSVKIFLKATGHIPTTGMTKALASRITRGKKDRFEKVKAIYYWCTAHTFRDKKVIGCGIGDVGKIIKKGDVENVYKNGYYGGKCTDLSSIFTALVRASGTPSREVFGIRLGKSEFSNALGNSKDGFANISSWQHCRAEYYIPGIGWIPTDPADITKFELVENLKHSNKRVQELNDKYLHSWEMNWVGFNYARDFDLSPRQKGFELNMFGYPYAELGNKSLDYYEPSSFAYKITSLEI